MGFLSQSELPLLQINRYLWWVKDETNVHELGKKIFEIVFELKIPYSNTIVLVKWVFACLLDESYEDSRTKGVRDTTTTTTITYL